MTRRLLCFLFAVLLSSRVLAAEPQYEITAKNMSTDPVTGEGVLTGEPKLAYRDAVLEADEIRMHPETRIATARGNARLTRGKQRLVAREIVYHTQEGRFSATGILLADFPYYLAGSDASGTRDEITIRNATITYYEPTFVSPTITADSLVFRPKVSVRAESATVGVGALQPVRFVTYEQALGEPFISFFTGTAGYRSSLGLYAGIGTRLPVATGVQAGGAVAFYTQRGILVGPSVAYQRGSGDQSYSGELKSGYIHDRGDTLNDIVGDPIPQDRGYIEWTHRQRFSENITLYGQLNYWSDSEFLRDFLPNQFDTVQQPDTFVEAAYKGQNHIFSAFVRAQPNSYYWVQQRLPEVRYDLLPSALPFGVIQQAQASVVSLKEDALLQGPTVKSNRFDAYYGLSRPISPKEWLNITPVVGGRMTHYADAQGGKDDYTRTLGEVGVDASLRTSGLFAYQNKRWGIDGLRHLMTPRVSYRYIPDADKGAAYIPAIDDETFQTYLPRLGLGEQRAIDQLYATNTLRFGLDNTVQTRDSTYGSRDLFRADFAVDFHPDTDPGQKDFSAIHTELSFTPVRWLQFHMYQSITPQNVQLREWNSGFSIHDGDQWSLYFGNHFLRDNLEEYIGEGRYRLNEAWQLYTRLHYDAPRNRFIDQSYGVIQNLNSLWTLRYSVTLEEGQSRGSDVSFNVEVHLLGF